VPPNPTGRLLLERDVIGSGTQAAAFSRHPDDSVAPARKHDEPSIQISIRFRWPCQAGAFQDRHESEHRVLGARPQRNEVAHADGWIALLEGSLQRPEENVKRIGRPRRGNRDPDGKQRHDARDQGCRLIEPSIRCRGSRAGGLRRRDCQPKIPFSAMHSWSKGPHRHRVKGRGRSAGIASGRAATIGNKGFDNVIRTDGGS